RAIYGGCTRGARIVDAEPRSCLGPLLGGGGHDIFLLFEGGGFRDAFGMQRLPLEGFIVAGGDMFFVSLSIRVRHAACMIEGSCVRPLLVRLPSLGFRNLVIPAGLRMSTHKLQRRRGGVTCR